MDLEAYLEQTTATRPVRMQWWHEARFGMFVHWGLYAQLGPARMGDEPRAHPRSRIRKTGRYLETERSARRASGPLAKQAGMKYMVMTTKHHEGFCLWDTQQTDYNAVKRGPGRDLVREYVEACREFGLKIGFYYSLMDWHHPDGRGAPATRPPGAASSISPRACVRELLTNYGQIDILWYDVSWPLESAERGRACR
jgi:alpha-L-fucosidase